MKAEGIIYFVGTLLGITLIWGFRNPIIVIIIGFIFVLLGAFGYFLMWFRRKRKYE